MALDLSLNKCKIMKSSCAISRFIFACCLDALLLSRVNCMTDLNVIFNTHFDFNDDYIMKISKARSLLRFFLQSLDFLFFHFILRLCNRFWNIVLCGQNYDVKMKKFHKGFLRFVLKDNAHLNYEQMCETLS